MGIHKNIPQLDLDRERELIEQIKDKKMRKILYRAIEVAEQQQAKLNGRGVELMLNYIRTKISEELKDFDIIWG